MSKKKKKEGVPLPLLWPRYIEKKWVERTLAYIKGEEIVTEEGSILPARTYDEIKETAFSKNLLLFTEELSPFSWFYDFPKGDEVILQGQMGEAIALRMKKPKKGTRWIVCTRSWGIAEVNYSVLETLRAVYDHCNVGTPTTPGGLGQTLMRLSWLLQFSDTWKAHRHQRPNGIACEWIQKHSTGSRSDRLLDRDFNALIEIDLKNGFSHCARKLMTGHTFRIIRSGGAGMVTYFCRCDVTIHSDLQLGPFPLRITEEGANNIYPTRRGKYENVHLWKEEVESCREAGCTVDVYEGYGWTEWTEDFGLWIELMEYLRDTAETEEIAGYVKHAIVAAESRFGMPSERYVLVGPEDKLEGDRPYAGQGGVALDLWIHKEVDYSPLTMPHWYAYILMKCRHTLYLKMLEHLPYVVASNTDGIFLTPDFPIEGYKSREEKSHTGDWRWRRLTQLQGYKMIPALRKLISREKIALPGEEGRAEKLRKEASHAL